MERFYKGHQPLFKYALFIEWALLAIAIAANACSIPFAKGVPGLIAALVMLLGLIPLSLYFPDSPHETVRRKRTYVAGEAALVTLAAACGLTDAIVPLYLPVMAKACMLLERREMRLAIGGCVVAEIAVSLVRLFLLQAIFSPTLPGDTLGLVVGFVAVQAKNLAVMALFVVLVMTMMTEQMLRWKVESLSKEVDDLSNEIEKVRIAREIHDTLGHTLTTLKLQLEVARKFLDVDRLRATKSLRTAEQLASRALTDVRVTLQQVREGDFDFEKSVTELIKNVESSSALTVRTEFQQTDFPVKVSYQLFRVIQECMTNTLKHADAKRVKISAGIENGKVSLVFWDDGNGFSYTAGTEGFGIRGMRERIEGLRGTINVASRSTGGTEVLVEVPLPAEPQQLPVALGSLKR